jgi:hypothetical protein
VKISAIPRGAALTSGLPAHIIPTNIYLQSKVAAISHFIVIPAQAEIQNKQARNLLRVCLIPKINISDRINKRSGS